MLLWAILRTISEGFLNYQHLDFNPVSQPNLQAKQAIFPVVI